MSMACPAHWAHADGGMGHWGAQCILSAWAVRSTAGISATVLEASFPVTAVCISLTLTLFD